MIPLASASIALFAVGGFLARYAVATLNPELACVGLAFMVVSVPPGIIALVLFLLR